MIKEQENRTHWIFKVIQMKYEERRAIEPLIFLTKPRDCLLSKRKCDKAVIFKYTDRFSVSPSHCKCYNNKPLLCYKKYFRWYKNQKHFRFIFSVQTYNVNNEQFKQAENKIWTVLFDLWFLEYRSKTKRPKSL